MTPNDCAGELNTLLPDGLTGTVEIDRALDGDYALRVQDGRVAIRASRLRHALCALGDVARAVRSGRPLRDKVVRSPLTCRMIEAWAPMHSHMFLPLPEYHEHSWHFRLREYGGVEVRGHPAPQALAWARARTVARWRAPRRPRLCR